jgi:DNA-binding XRE family transcriptional regulator
VAVSRYSKKLVAHVVEVLRDKREGLGISKKKLASDAGVSRTAIILMESYRRLPSLELTIKLAMGLGIPFSSVVTDAEQRMAKKLSRQSEPPERSE